MAHFWHHTFPITGRLPSHASGAHDIAAPTTQLLPKEPSSGCAAIVCVNAESEGELDKERGGEKCRQGQQSGVMAVNVVEAMSLRFIVRISAFSRILLYMGCYPGTIQNNLYIYIRRIESRVDGAEFVGT